VRQIVAIGGGELREGETLPLDRFIVSLTNKANPNALFIPTASHDSADYCVAFERIYGDQLGCDVDYLRLYEGEPGGDDFEAKLEWADLVYVGGGNTRTMVALWQELGVDSALRGAWERGVVLSGLSAGANCWMKHANSDAPQLEGRTDVLTIKIDCLDFLPLIVCPHMAREECRLPEFSKMMRTTPGVGIGLDDLAALYVRDDEYRILSCGPDAVAHKIGVVDGEIRHERIEPSDAFRPLAELTSF
jgi:dipeptidase E